MQNLLFAAFEQLLDARIEAAITAGTYDVGVETLTAESFRVVERRTVHSHAGTGAKTRCYRVLRKDRNRPLPLAEALALRADNGRLLINEQTRRAAVQMHAASLMDDDGNVEIRTRLIRPMTRETISVERFDHSHWRKATREEFSALWEAEYARVPEFSESAVHIITGLLLPIWDQLPAQNMRVYCFEADDARARHRPPRHPPRRSTASTQASVSSVARGPGSLAWRGLERRHRARRGARSCRRLQSAGRW